MSTCIIPSKLNQSQVKITDLLTKEEFHELFFLNESKHLLEYFPFDEPFEVKDIWPLWKGALPKAWTSKPVIKINGNKLIEPLKLRDLPMPESVVNLNPIYGLDLDYGENKLPLVNGTWLVSG